MLRLRKERFEFEVAHVECMQPGDKVSAVRLEIVTCLKWRDAWCKMAVVGCVESVGWRVKD